MPDFLRYYGRFQTARGGFGSLPQWARSIVGIFALPGIVLVVLSIGLFLISILALLLLTVPVYRILQTVTGSRPRPAVAPTQEDLLGGVFGNVFNPDASAGRKQVNLRVVDPSATEN